MPPFRYINPGSVPKSFGSLRTIDCQDLGLCDDLDAHVRALKALRIERVRRLDAWHVVCGSGDGSGSQVSSAYIKSSRCGTCCFLA